MREPRERSLATLPQRDGRERRITLVRLGATLALLGTFVPALAQPAAAQDGIDGNTYVSPTYGYELEWDEDTWEAQDESSNGRDSLVLVETDSTSYVYLEGYEAYDGDPNDCLEGSADEILGQPAVDDIEPLEDEDGDEVAGDEDGVVFAAYSFVIETDDGAQERAGYFTCQALIEDEAVVAFSFIGVLDEVEDDLPVWEDLVASLTLPGDADSRGEDEDDRPSDDEDADDNGDSDAGNGDDATTSFAGGPAHTGEQPGPAPADEPDELWAFETGDDFVGANAVAVSLEEGLVFTSSNAVYAIDIETGEEVWTYESESNVGFVSPLSVIDGVLYAAGEDGFVYAFEAESGDIIWESEVTDGMPVNGGPLVIGETIYVTAWDGNAYALETETGDVIGNTSIGGIGYGQPSYADDYLVLSAPSDGVLALPLEDDDDWLYETDGPVYAAPIIIDGIVYFGSDDGNLYAVELESGDEVWSVDTDAPINGALASSGGVVYVVNGDAILGAYDAESGDELWTTEIDGENPGGVTVTETEDGDLLILVGDADGVLHAFDEDGEEAYTVEVTDAAIFWPASVIDGVIYVSARDGTVYALGE